MKNHEEEGPDRGWSWVIAFASFFISLILIGIYRTSGILLVAFVSEYGVSREDSSWPLFLCFSVVDLSGLIVGPLGQKFGVRPITLVGALVAALGMSLCYFANSLTFITLSFGVIFGLGFGFAFTLMPVIVNDYFLNFRATANGIANSGGCFGSFILPPLYEYLTFTYGLNGCLLILGGIVLQLAICGALMKPPSWLKRAEHDSADEVLDVENRSRYFKTSENVHIGYLETNPKLDNLRHCDNVLENTVKQNEKVVNETRLRQTDIVECFDDRNVDQFEVMCVEPNDMNSTQYGGSCSKVESIFELEALLKENKCNSDIDICNTPYQSNKEVKELRCLSACNYIDENNDTKELAVAISKKDKNSMLTLKDKYQQIENPLQKCIIPYTHTNESDEETRIDDSMSYCDSNSPRKEKKEKLLIENLIKNPESEMLNRTEISNLNKKSNYKVTGHKLKEQKQQLVHEKESNISQPYKNSNISILKSFHIVLSCPMFYIIALSHVIFFSNEEMYFVINADFFNDKSVAENDVKYIFMAFSISDLIGRLCFGWVTDRNFLRRSHFMMLCLAAGSILFFGFPFANGFMALMILNCVYGLVLGCTNIVFTVLPVDYLDMEIQSVAFGSIAFLSGILTLMCSVLIGFFRDNLGSYSNIFYLMGALSAVASLTWLLEKHLVKPANTLKKDES